jgi:phage terminase large subunit-like protein
MFEPSKRRLTWDNRAIATLYSADEGERLRGPEHDCLAVDELGSWRDRTAWDNAMFGLRIGKNPQVAVATTPRPTRLLREIVSREGNGVVISRGATRENSANLSPAFLDQVVGRYSGTRLGRQELDGELLEDVAGALWSRANIDATRTTNTPELTRIVVAIDPAVSTRRQRRNRDRDRRQNY